MDCKSILETKNIQKLFKISNSLHSDSSSCKEGSARKVFNIVTIRKPNPAESNEKSEQCVHTGNWTEEEHNRFLIAIKKYGNSWKRIEAYVATRSRIQIRSHCQKYFDNLRLKAIAKAKSKRESKMFVVYQTYRNTTYDFKKSGKIDYELDIEKFKKELKEAEDMPKEVELNEDDITLFDFGKFPNIKGDNIFQDFQSDFYYDENHEADKISDNASIHEGGLNKEDFMEDDFDMPILASKREANWQEDNFDYCGTRRLTKIKYDI